jgi:hypothetical protein
VIPDLRSTVVASDNCNSGRIPGRYPSPEPGHDGGLGTTVVVFTVKDLLNNQGTATTHVSVVDHTPPSVVVLGANPLVLEAGGTLTDPGASASDACAGTLPVLGNQARSTPNQPGSYALIYTAK